MKNLSSLIACLGILLIISCQPKTVKNSSNTSTNKATSTNRTYSNEVNTAQNESYMSKMEKEMIAEINYLRSDPKAYIKHVETYIEEQKQHKANGTGFGNENEEIKTAKELIAQLKKTPRLSILKPHKGVFKAAKTHGIEGKKKGSLDHQGKNGSWPWDRVKKYAPDLIDGNENLVGGPSSIQTAVMILLVDTGIPNRGHRKTLLNPDWKYIACYYVGKVADMPNYWVQKFAK